VDPLQPAHPLPAVEYAERSDPGRDPEKQVNEDAAGRRETRLGHLCVVCDGMGGHAAGREAAELALTAIFETFELAPEGASPPQVLRSAIEEASRRIHTMRTSEIALGRPGCTVVAVLMHANGTEVAHVGDSRVYFVHEGQISRLTRDHSVVQEMVDRGLLTPQQAVNHPDGNRITRALGMAEEVDVEIRPSPVHHVAGDTLVLCSDGLSDLVEDREILEIVGSEPAAQAVGRLVDLANARGGHDNVTVIALRARETALGGSGTVAPTIAQTNVTQAPSPPALLPGARIEQHTAPGEVARPPAAWRASEASDAPASIRSLPRRRANPAVVVAVLLGVGAVALLGSVLFAHFAERRGKRNTPTTLALPMSDAATPTPIPVAPESVVLPSANAPAEPIAPLEPAATATAGARRSGGGHK
jgi:serine/threonine protein phosphatase PrpC